MRQHWVGRLVLGLMVMAMCSCHPSKDAEFRMAEAALQSKDYPKAVKLFSRLIKKDPNSPMAVTAARTAARVALFQAEDFSKAIEFFRHLVLYSKDPKERMLAQRNVASIYFDKLSDYKNAIIEYNRLLALSHSPEDVIDYRFQLAKSYYYMNNFFQSKVEIDELLKSKAITDPQRFEITLFKGNILLTNKQVDQALEIFKQVKEMNPELARKEKVGMSIAVCYEELNDYDKAIAVLEELKTDYPRPDFIELKIKRLHQRRANQPGAKGFRK